MGLEPNEVPVRDAILQFIDVLQSLRDVFDDDYSIFQGSIHFEKLSNGMEAT